MAHDLLLGKTPRRHGRDSDKSSGLDDLSLSYFRKHPLSYRAKTAILLAAGFTVFVFSRRR